MGRDYAEPRGSGFGDGASRIGLNIGAQFHDFLPANHADAWEGAGSTRAPSFRKKWAGVTQPSQVHGYGGRPRTHRRALPIQTRPPLAAWNGAAPERQTAAERAVDNARRYATVARSEIEIYLIYAEHQVRRTPYAGQRP